MPTLIVLGTAGLAVVTSTVDRKVNPQLAQLVG
jgi:hypothetical protein